MASRLAPNQNGNICLKTNKVYLIKYNMLRKVLEYFSAEPDIQHLNLDAPERTRRHLQIIQKKTFLRKLYYEWYSEIIQGLSELREGFVLELGSGGGFLKQLKPDIITSEIIHLSNVDVILDGLVLPFSDKSLQGIVMVDVFHHLPRPAQFLNEAARCIKPGGVIIMIEPWYSIDICITRHGIPTSPYGSCRREGRCLRQILHSPG
jgi:SAM-dependent methyltransferase